MNARRLLSVLLFGVLFFTWKARSQETRFAVIEVVELHGSGVSPPDELATWKSIPCDMGILQCADSIQARFPYVRVRVAEYFRLQGPFQHRLRAQSTRPFRLPESVRVPGRYGPIEGTPQKPAPEYMYLQEGSAIETLAVEKDGVVALNVQFATTYLIYPPRITKEPLDAAVKALPGTRTLAWGTRLRLKETECMVMYHGTVRPAARDLNSWTVHLVRARGEASPP